MHTGGAQGSALLHGLGVAHVGLYLGDVLDLVRVRVRARVRARFRVRVRVISPSPSPNPVNP